MQFQTHIDIKPFKENISHSHSILSLGSCFADNIAKHLSRSKFQVTASPTGILFNPESIALAIERFSEARYNNEVLPTHKELHENDGVWYNYDFHSSLSHNDIDVALTQMRNAIMSGAEAMAKADIIIITFGTAFAYRLKENGRVVANCHKQPQRCFTRELLHVDQIVQRYTTLLQGVLANKRVIFTLSPVRHLGDGLEQNSLSKATLRVALSEIIRKNDNCEYFPSYEIMMDELRDYRFYADDMAHPSTLAIDYIWERFTHTAFTKHTLELIDLIGQVVTATQHRPFNPTSEAHQKFCMHMLRQIEKIEQVNPTICFEQEKEYFRGYL